MRIFKKLNNNGGWVQAAIGLGTAALSLMGRKGQSASAREVMQMQIAEAQKNRDFQERMSNTAHQRQVKDLEKAGLNPMLSIMQGGAATPAGAQAQLRNPEEGLSGDIANSARAAAEVKNILANAKLSREKSKTEQVTQTLIGSQAQSAKAEARIRSQQADIETSKGGRLWRHLTRFLNPIRGVIGGSANMKLK